MPKLKKLLLKKYDQESPLIDLTNLETLSCNGYTLERNSKNINKIKNLYVTLQYVTTDLDLSNFKSLDLLKINLINYQFPDLTFHIKVDDNLKKIVWRDCATFNEKVRIYHSRQCELDIIVIDRKKNEINKYMEEIFSVLL